ncbi:MAG: hypothetical protein LBV54_05365, partial [Puniceicoccales bacterium]|nr:hypothetical protein [Puniceicoccales bacterium]
MDSSNKISPVSTVYPPLSSSPFQRATAVCRRLASRFFVNRMGGAAVFFAGFLAVALLTRCALLVKSASTVDWGAALAGAFATGAVFDIGAGLFPAGLVAVALAALPRGFFTHRPGRVLAWVGVGVGAGLMLFGAVAEWLFWDEFGTRFNFIAVDYLIYTKEVTANIRESYPLPAIFGALALVSAVLAFGLVRIGAIAIWMNAPAPPARRRWLVAAGWVGAAVLGAFALDSGRSPSFANTYNAELSRNGLWSLFAAFRNNELNYDQFYATLPREAAFARLDT